MVVRRVVVTSAMAVRAAVHGWCWCRRRNCQVSGDARARTVSCSLLLLRAAAAFQCPRCHKHAAAACVTFLRGCVLQRQLLGDSVGDMVHGGAGGVVMSVAQQFDGPGSARTGCTGVE